MTAPIDEVLYVTFNQDSSALSVGTKKGYQLYSLSASDELVKLHDTTPEPDIYIIERLFSSSLVTYVTLNSPRKLQVVHFQKQQEICSQSYSNSILAVRLNRTRLIVCLEESLYIHNIRDMKVLHTIRDTPPNPAGVCELSSHENSFLAYPGSVQNGEVQVFDACNLQAVTMITAHSGRIAALKFSVDGSKLATASEKGTVIKVFSVPVGDKLFEFRRGVKRCAAIYSLAFSADGLLLACSSSTETVHVFKLEHKGVSAANAIANASQHGGSSDERQHRSVAGHGASTDESGVQGWVNFVSKTAASYLPTPVSDMFQQDRAFATAKLTHAGSRSVCALTCVKQQKLRLLVASMDGRLYTFDFNADDGGDCQLIRQFRLDTHHDKATAVPSGSSHKTSTNVGDGQSSKNETNSAGELLAPKLGSFNLDDDQEFPPVAHTSG